MPRSPVRPANGEASTDARASAVDWSRFRWALAASGAAFAALCIFMTVASGTRAAKRTSDLVLGGGALLAAWSCARAAKRGGPDARGWRLVALAALVWAVGDAIWAVYGLTRHDAYPYPSVADIGFLGFGVVAGLALLSFPRRRESTVSRARSGLDALVIAATILFISWSTVLGPLYRTQNETLLIRVTGLAYPIVDVLVVSLVLALGMRRARTARLPWLFLGGGLVTLALTDGLYVSRAIQGIDTSGAVFYVGWFAAFLLIALAALVPVRSLEAPFQARHGRVEEFLPYLPFLGVLVIIATRGLSLAEDPFLSWSGLVCLVAFGARQAMIVTENSILGDDLQAEVEKRTAQLAEANRALTGRSEAMALLRTIATSASAASTTQEALQSAVEEVCRHTGWPIGHVWLASEDSAHELLPTAIWHFDDDERFSAFRRASEVPPLFLGLGLPARATSTARPAWIADVTADTNFPRAAVADEVGIRAGFAVPMLAGRLVVGVLEFFSTEVLPADPPLLDLIVQAGAELGRMVERRRAEDALGQGAARTRSILEAANDGFVGMDDRGLITDWNRSAEALFGWSREEALGRSVADTIVPPANRQAHNAGLARLLATGEGPVLGQCLELSALHRDGHEFTAELSIWASDDSRRSFSAFVRNVTDRKQSEIALAEARDRALDATRAKSEFLATMSHEIRSPMNGVIGLTGLLLGTPLTEAQRHHAEGVRASGEALLSIVNDILDFSKIEAGKLELETVDFDLAQALEDVGSLVSESARAKGLELVIDCCPEVPRALRGDVGRLRQILLNFATNAVKFTTSGEVVLRAGLAEEPTAEGVVVRFEVVDTGMGVDPATAERLFEPFSQADASTARRHGGTGLGLAICRRLADAMGGSIGVEGRPDTGSTFWMRLPVAFASEPVSAGALTGELFPGRRVLIVEDNQTNRLVLAAQLRAWGMEADPARDAEEALARLRQAVAQGRPYDVALLDTGMPRAGPQLAGVIASDPRLESVRLLLLCSDATDAEIGADAGVVAHLIKPVRLSALYDALVRALSASLPGQMNEVAEHPAVASGCRGTLLIVEDNAINQTVAKGMAARLGYGCDVAGNGIEALEALVRRPYDVVLMDCQMPEMDGFEATAEVRRREAGRRHVPIVAMTAGVLAGDREKCLSAGMDDYMSKPVRTRDLEAVLGRWAPSGANGPAGNVVRPHGNVPSVPSGRRHSALLR